MVKRLAFAAALLALLGVLAGCGPAALGASTLAVAPKKAGFSETAKGDGIVIALAIDPVKVGDNRFVVSLDRKDVAAVEAQVIMATMGHGQVVDLVQSSPGKFEASSPVIDMEGRWMVRVKATLESGEEKDATFHLVLKP